MTTLKKYTAVLATMIISVVALPTTANAADIHIKVPSILVSLGSNDHYNHSYNKKKVYSKKRHSFSKTSNNKSKYYANSRNSNTKFVTTKKVVKSGNSFNRNSKTVVRKTRVIR